MLTHRRSGTLTVEFHETFEVGIVLRGELERQTETSRRILNQGEVWLNAAWEPHMWKPLRPDTTELVCHFRADFLGEEMLAGRSWLALFAAPPRVRAHGRTRETRELAVSVAYEMLQEVERKRAGWHEAVRYAVLRLLLALIRDGKPAEVARAGVEVKNFIRLLPAIHYAQGEVRSKKSRQEAATRCRLSPSHFGNLFQQTLGISFGVFSLRARLAGVAQELLKSNRTVEELARRHGFTHGSHLHRQFMKYYGRSPGGFRQLGR
jgi:AraC-like DNA-binding protein